MARESVIINQKDSVFRMLFKEKKELLSLYNAVNGTHYQNEDDLEIRTLENAVYMATKNDLAFLLYTGVHLYEQQASVNPNMPLRYLQYFSTICEKYYVTAKIYTKTRIMLPAPVFIVFYNGVDEQPERRIMKLSDSFERGVGKDSASCDISPNLELVVLQLNINSGYNEDLKKNCPALMGYIKYQEKIRQYRKTMDMEKAVNRAVDECIKEGILSDFLRKNKAEVRKMSIFEFDQEEYEAAVREEERKEGIKEGEDSFGKMTKLLLAQDRSDDLLRATDDAAYRKELYAELGIM